MTVSFVWFLWCYNNSIMTEKLCGIYSIINCINSHCYIGSSTNIKQRWNMHLFELRHDKHHSQHLQRAWNKYGASNFEFRILEVLSNFDGLILTEQAWIDKINPEYNICKVCCNTPLGVRRTDETRKKLSKALKGKKQPPCSEEHKQKISIALKIACSQEKTKQKKSNASRGRIHSDEWKQKIGDANSRIVYQYTRHGEFIAQYKSLTEAEKITGVTHISCCASGKRLSAGGYIWRYEAK